MTRLYETKPAAERVYLVGFWEDAAGKPEAAALLDELAALSLSLGCEAAGSVLLHSRGPAGTLGRGQAAEIACACARLSASRVIFDCELGPSRQRDWEKLCGVEVSCRHEVILNIFAARARTREAALQVELARLRYQLPRLSHKYEGLARQRGGSYGAKGAGETRFESDRRTIERRLSLLEREIEGIRLKRAVRRAKREKEGVPVCALAGYTNAGKSSLLNRLCGADVYAADKLFATLDTASRRLVLPPGADGGERALILSDTVGFIRRLPHDLISAFRSTLEEVVYAGLVIHVIDASGAEAASHAETTDRVLAELGAGDSPRITVLNKADRPEAAGNLAALALARPGAIAVSARTGAGLPELRAEIGRRLWGPDGTEPA